MKTLAILGGGGHASDVLSVVESQANGETFDHITVGDDEWAERNRFSARSVNMIEPMLAALDHGDFFVAGIGYPEPRRKVVGKAVGLGGAASPVLVHRSADLGHSFAAGAGSVVFGQVWISANVVVGGHVHVSYGCTVGHDTKIGSFTSVMPGACIAGDVEIGEAVLVGAGAVILQGLSVGTGSVVGAGAVVTRDVAPGATVVGAPARART